MSQSRVVMKDIALRAGVHQTTVSLALRNDPRISQETRDRVQALAKEMGYVPDPALTSLVAYRRSSKIKRDQETIALVFDVKDPTLFNESEYLPSIREEVTKRASELGYKVDVFIQGVDFSNWKMLDRVLLTRNIHGILFGGIYQENTTVELDFNNYCMVKISQSPHDLEIDSVMGNSFFSVRKIMRKLKELGFNRPAMAGSVTDEQNTRHVYRAGFLYGQVTHFAPENHIPFYEFTRKPNPQLIEEIYQWLRAVKPDVFISYWNNLVEAAYRLTVEDGHSCRFVCVEADSKSRALGGIRNNYRKMARTAIELLVSKMQMNNRGIPESATTTLVDSKWCDLGEWPPDQPVSLDSPALKS
jgi:LacI family transcriptional regulator